MENLVAVRRRIKFLYTHKWRNMTSQNKRTAPFNGCSFFLFNYYHLLVKDWIILSSTVMICCRSDGSNFSSRSESSELFATYAAFTTSDKSKSVETLMTLQILMKFSNVGKFLPRSMLDTLVTLKPIFSAINSWLIPAFSRYSWIRFPTLFLSIVWFPRINSTQCSILQLVLIIIQISENHNRNMRFDTLIRDSSSR